MCIRDRHWMKNRVQQKTSGIVTSVTWKSFDCELCKKQLQEYLEVDGSRYDLVSFPRPPPPYLMFELMSKDKNTIRGVHIVSMGKKSLIKVGRSHDSDLRVPDISVSRFHAVLKFDEGHFYLEDRNSKFGTLALLPPRTPLTGDFLRNGTIQIGPTLFTLNLPKGRGSTSFNRSSINDKSPVVLIKQLTGPKEIPTNRPSLMTRSAPNRPEVEEEIVERHPTENLNNFDEEAIPEERRDSFTGQKPRSLSMRSNQRV
eukprot:TRINITY_DN13010_c0_g1_i2.p1 TRINITY_DN13010_c0_g1~~TRINITY_DN13010_c0_g1_i2.p1  ORF type:complete len:276 (+),score=53.02 TRINITY_DN13010_c0_g1_i2:60-830(+)